MIKKIFIVVVFITAALSAALLFKSPLFNKCLRGERINLLVMGTDQVRGGYHSDVVLWISYEPKTRFIDIVSVPRDALIKWDERKKWIPRKLSEILYLNTKRHGTKKGIDLFKQELENFLAIKFDYHMVLTFTAFANFIDAVGKIPITIDKPMHYDDNWGGLHIHFEPGNYMLNGADSLKYVRFRHSSLGDMGRIQRQQLFLKKLFLKIFEFKTVLATSDFLKIYKEDIFTNLSLIDIFAITDILRTFSVGNQRYQILPGISQIINSKDVWKLDKKAMAEIKTTIQNSDRELWPRTKIRPFIIKRGPKSLQGIQAEVFNATKKRGIAEKLTEKLREYGCDVVLWSNWGNYKKHTEVIARKGDLSKANRTANVMGCSHIRTEIDSSRMVDISIVIGTDFPEEFS